MDSILASLKESWLGGRKQRRSAPHIESLVAAVEHAFENPDASAEALMALGEVRGRLTEARRELEALDGAASEEHAALLGRVHEIYCEKDALLEQMEGAIAQQDRGTALDLCEHLRAATSDLFDAMDALAALEQAISDGTVVLPFAFADVYHACGQVVHGAISQDAWLGRVTALERSLSADLEALAPFQEVVQADDETAALFDEVRDYMTQAIEALALIRSYALDRDVARLDDGWTSLAAAAVAIREALGRAAQGQDQLSSGKVLDWGEA